MGKKQPRKEAPVEYRVIADGINWPDPDAPAPESPMHAPRDKRAERGDMVRDLPAEIAKAFLDAGHIEALEDTAPPAAVDSPEEVKE
jgi:hypothetical protein